MHLINSLELQLVYHIVSALFLAPDIMFDYVWMHLKRIATWRIKSNRLNFWTEGEKQLPNLSSNIRVKLHKENHTGIYLPNNSGRIKRNEKSNQKFTFIYKIVAWISFYRARTHINTISDNIHAKERNILLLCLSTYVYQVCLSTQLLWVTHM